MDYGGEWWLVGCVERIELVGVQAREGMEEYGKLVAGGCGAGMDGFDGFEG